MHVNVYSMADLTFQREREYVHFQGEEKLKGFLDRVTIPQTNKQYICAMS